MGQAAEATGTLDVAIAHAQRLLARDPRMAAQQAREIIRVIPGQPRALSLLGQALAATGQRDEAIAMLRRAAERDPGSADTWRTLADQLVLVGDEAGADAAYARHLRASVNDPVLRDAAAALVENRLAIAERILKPYLHDHPTDIAAIRMLAELAGRLGRNEDAETLLRRALELAPSFAPARFNLATALHRQHRPIEALEQLDRLLDEAPDDPAYRNLRGAVLGRLGDFERAVGEFETVLGHRPDNAAIWMSYGHSLKTLGRQGESVAAYRRSIALEAGKGEAWWSLANLKTVRLDEADVARMERALTGKIGAEDRFHLHFALGKALEDAGEWQGSFHHYAAGNRLRRERLPYDAGEMREQAERARRLFAPALLSARAGAGSAAADPIFILGLPRAGSTLIEQILASHPLVEGTQELPDIIAIAHRLSARGSRAEPSRYPEVLATLSPEELRALGEDYLAASRSYRRTDRPYFVDKMPNNWAHVGLIHLILPNAKIIDARRHPLSSGFSNFKQHFARGQAFSYDLADIGRYYAEYAGLMAHFDAVLPGRVHRVFYERMVADTETEVRRLLAYCRLDFDPACLRFHENDRAVRTASSEQVRRPIFREGLDRWRHYEPWLGPLRDALGPALDYYPHDT